LAAAVLLALTGCLQAPVTERDPTASPGDGDWVVPWHAGDSFRYEDDQGRVRDFWVLGLLDDGLVALESREGMKSASSIAWEEPEYLAVRGHDLAFLPAWSSRLPPALPACDSPCEPGINHRDLEPPYHGFRPEIGLGLVSWPMQAGDSWTSTVSRFLAPEEQLRTRVISVESRASSPLGSATVVSLRSTYYEEDVDAGWAEHEGGAMEWSFDIDHWLPVAATIGPGMQPWTAWFAPSDSSSEAHLVGRSDASPAASDLAEAHRRINEAHMQKVAELVAGSLMTPLDGVSDIPGDRDGPTRAVAFDFGLFHGLGLVEANLTLDLDQTPPGWTPCALCGLHDLGRFATVVPGNFTWAANATYFGRHLGMARTEVRIGYAGFHELDCQAPAVEALNPGTCGGLTFPAGAGLPFLVSMGDFDCEARVARGALVVYEDTGDLFLEADACESTLVRGTLPADATGDWSVRFEPDAIVSGDDILVEVEVVTARTLLPSET
jgi:hypothetical protein